MNSVQTLARTPAATRGTRGERDQSPSAEPFDGAGPAGLGTLETRFGPVPLDPDRQFRFRGGLPGFPAVEWFQLDPIPGLESDLLILQSVDAPGVGFITLPLPEDIPLLRQADLADITKMLAIAPGELMVLAIVTLAASGNGIEKYLNLRAPLFIDVRRKVGAQVVLADARYPLRYRLTPTET